LSQAAISLGVGSGANIGVPAPEKNAQSDFPARYLIPSLNQRGKTPAPLPAGSRIFTPAGLSRMLHILLSGAEHAPNTRRANMEHGILHILRLNGTLIAL
jgi:hypothetical protein